MNFRRDNFKTELESCILCLSVDIISCISPDFKLFSLSYSLRTLESAFTCLLFTCPRTCSPWREVDRLHATYTYPWLNDLCLFKLKLTTFWSVKPWTSWTVHAQARVVENWILCTSGEDGLPGCWLMHVCLLYLFICCYFNVARSPARPIQGHLECLHVILIIEPFSGVNV